jgi:hypothetical protein
MALFLIFDRQWLWRLGAMPFALRRNVSRGASFGAGRSAPWSARYR